MWKERWESGSGLAPMVASFPANIFFPKIVGRRRVSRRLWGGAEGAGGSRGGEVVRARGTPYLAERRRRGSGSPGWTGVASPWRPGCGCRPAFADGGERGRGHGHGGDDHQRERMNTMRWSRGATGPAILAALALAAPAPLGAQQDDPALTTRAERTDYVETSRLEDVQRFLEALSARSDLVRVGTFGTSEQGRPLLLVTLSSPAVARPEDARALGRPVVFVQANIHGGEVEGKEAMQILMRRLAFGDLRPLLDRLVVVI